MFFSFHRRIHRSWLDRYEQFYHPRHRYGRWHLLLDSILALSIVSLVLYNGYFFGLKPLLLRPPLEVSVRITPETLSVGGAATLEISYRYHGSEPLRGAAVDIKPPQSFEFDGTEPTAGFDASRLQWDMPEINPGSRGTLKYFGRQWSVNGRQEPFTITVAAESPDGGRQTLAIVDGWIETRIPFVQAKTKIPSTIVLGQDTTVDLILTNPTDRALPALRVLVTPPDGWNTTRAVPALEQNAWNVDAIEANGTRVFSLRGQYKQLPKSPSFFFSVTRSTRGQELLSIRADTTIADPGLELSATADTPGSIEPGQEIPVTITYVNRGDFSLENVTIALTPRGVYVDPNRLRSDTGTVANGTVTWTPKQISNLKQIVPSQRGSLRMTIATKPAISLVDRSPLDDFSIIVQPQAQLRLPILPDQSILWYGSTTALAVNTTIGMDATAQYYTSDGEQVGRGAFPPRVGRRTTLWLTVTVNNTIHDLYSARVAMTLAPHVQWTNRSSVTVGQPIQWDQTTNALIWKLDRLDAMLGQSPRTATASVELALIPTREMVGQAVPLVSAVTATGIDGATKVNRSAALPAITTGSAKTATVDGKVRP